MKLRDCNAILRHSGIKTKWLRLHINALFLLEGILLSIALLYYIFTSAPLFAFTTQQLIIEIMNKIEFAARVLFAFLLFWFTRNLVPKAYVMNIIHIWWEFIRQSFIILSKIFKPYESGQYERVSNWVFIFVLFTYLIGLILQLIYFKKRKHLFRIYTPNEIAHANSRANSKRGARPAYPAFILRHFLNQTSKK